MSFYAKFDDVANIFDGYEATTSFDPFDQQSDVDRTGLDSESDDLIDDNPFESDDEGEEAFEDLDDDDVEPGEDVDEESLNEPDLDFEDDLEPDWSPEDQMEAEQATDATDISDEQDPETADTEIDDAPHDQFDEVTPDAEISQDDDISEVDDIWQGEEVGFDEPLFYPDEDDDDPDLTDDAIEDILSEHTAQDDITDDIINDIIVDVGQAMIDAGLWVDSLEDFLDFTEQDVSSFHDIWGGFEQSDLYDPEYPDFMADDMLELGNFVDDVFASTMDSQFVDADPFFSWFDSFGDM